ncbi:MAG: HEAT repeat domain-containing protein [Gammaproteobacteria bacterium]|nr:MAG: HEAT repeat domain-containing protein [Gammaproteobacteria bacterium]
MNNLGSFKTIAAAAATGAVLTWAGLNLTSNESLQREQIAILESRIEGLESLLAQKDDALNKARSRSWTSGAQTQAVTRQAAAKAQAANNAALETALMQAEGATVETPIDSQKVLRDLSSKSEGDSRSFSAKVNDLLAINPSPENVAIVSQGVVDKAGNPEVLSDQELEVLYQSQTNSEVKRVAAQVLSMRGDNRLIEKQISGAQDALRSESPTERQQALIELGKTHYAGAANAIAPLLQDSNIDVKMNALLALKSTGNQSHVPLIESLAHSQDPNVSWLANDVINTLQNLSEKARTKVTSSDAMSELPPVPDQ